MQESIFILISVLLALTAGYWLNRQSRTTYWFTFLILVIAVMLRPTWAFAGILLLMPRKEDIYINLSGFVPFSLLFILGVFSQVLLAESLSAVDGTPAFHEILTLLGSGEVYAAISRTYYNLLQNLFYFKTFSIGDVPALYHVLKWVPLGFMALLVVQLRPCSITRANSAPLAIISITVLFVFLLYEAYFWREIRMWTAPFYLTLFLSEGKVVGFFRGVLATLSVVSFFLFGIKFQQEQIATRSLSDEDSKKLVSKETCLEPLTREIPESSRVLLDFSLTGRIEMCALPLVRDSGSRIKYVLPFYRSVKKHHELILMPNNANLPNDMIGETNCFTLVNCGCEEYAKLK